MKTIWKYPLQIASRQSVNLPVGSAVLCVQMQLDALCLWVLVDTDSKQISAREFDVFGTGHPMDPADRRYIGTVQQLGGNLIWHVFERI